MSCKILVESLFDAFKQCRIWGRGAELASLTTKSLTESPRSSFLNGLSHQHIFEASVAAEVVALVSPLTLGAWNVRSLLENPRRYRPERRMALVARELARYKVDIAGLSETRFSEQGQLEEVGAGLTFWSDRPQAVARRCVLTDGDIMISAGRGFKALITLLEKKKLLASSLVPVTRTLPTLDNLDTFLRICNPDDSLQDLLMIEVGSDGFASLVMDYTVSKVASR
ncbi:unnamed protein product [Schistocephalus solidus]|uniref:Uncharacterized protein n=1 Tax=Schistocephalus solidus TaxID=70667 RepID=A0A183SGH9_SCHSO|nr:unnamed protein product [Schistocephalus solidus]